MTESSPWVSGDGSPADRLALADWRRRIAELYAEVRAMAATDPEAAWTRWRTVREDLFRTHPQSPVPAAERGAFRATYFAYDPRLRFTARVEPADDVGDVAPLLGAAPVTLPSSGLDTLSFARLGWIRLPLPEGERRLGVYWMTGYAGGLFVPFRDATNGAETYGAGRYLLDTAKSADLGTDPATGDVILDANFAIQPSCAFDPRWICPLAPPENRLDVPIRAGERLA